MKKKIRLRVNGKKVEQEVDTNRMMVDFLRYDLGLTGTKEGCSVGVCGACTVLMDGEMISSCIAPAVFADGREITTVEGLDESDPVLRAFNAEHAFQCGWCTPGFVLTVKAMRPGEDVRAALGGNLCRCGCYVKIEEAVRRCAT